jgi:ankyrin repeat protein
MHPSTIVSARPIRQIRWSLPLLLVFVLSQPGTLLHAASNVAAVVDAAKADNLPAVHKLVKEKADVNAASGDGTSALLWAAFHSNAEMTKALLAAGAAVDAANRYGVTPLLQASRNGDAAVIRALLDAGAQPTRWHPEGETPLMAASRTGHVDAIQLLLSHGSFVNAVDPFQEQTAIMWASAEGHAEAVKTLLAAGADPNLKAHVSLLTERRNADHPSGGFTALMFAARNGHSEVVKVLMKGGADPKLTNADGLTATMVAIVNDRFDLAKEMLDLGADPNDGSLFYAVDMHDQTTDTRAQDATRMQPDHANKMTSLALVKALLDLGADANKPWVGSFHSTSMCCGPSMNSSPFFRAAAASDVEVLKLLLAKGAQIEWSPVEVKAVDGKRPAPALNGSVGLTPLMMAMKGGGGPPIQGGPGYTRAGSPVFREPGSRDPLEAVNLLLAAKANPNAKTPDGATPLHQAVRAQQVAIIRALAEAGGSLTALNKDKLTPVDLAQTMAGDPPARGKKDSKDQVLAALKELLHLGPDDALPPPPESAKKDAPKGNAVTPLGGDAQ